MDRAGQGQLHFELRPEGRAFDPGLPRWGRRLIVPCERCGIPTHRHRTLDYSSANTYRPQAGPDPETLGVDPTESAGEEPDMAPAWIALVPGDFPYRTFGLDEVFHLSGGIAWPGPHNRDYGKAKVAHDPCCPALHRERPASSRGAAELWQAMRLHLRRRQTPR